MFLQNNWKQKSLENLEKTTTIDLKEKSSFLITRCTQLRKIPVGDFTIEDLRIMIGQQIGLQYLVPLAIDELKKDLFAEGDYYPGDLLKSVLSIGVDFWRENKELWVEVNRLILSQEPEIEEEGISPELFKSAYL